MKSVKIKLNILELILKKISNQSKYIKELEKANSYLNQQIEEYRKVTNEEYSTNSRS